MTADPTPQPTPDEPTTGGHFSWRIDEQRLTKPTLGDVDPLALALADARTSRASLPVGHVGAEFAAGAATSLARIAEEVGTELANWQVIEQQRVLTVDEVQQRALSTGALDSHITDTVGKATKALRGYEAQVAEMAIPPLPSASEQRLCREDLAAALGSGDLAGYERVAGRSRGHLAVAASAWGVDQLAAHLDGGAGAAEQARDALLERALRESTDPVVVAHRKAVTDLYRRHASGQLALLLAAEQYRMGANRAAHTTAQIGHRG